jgi:hypothetical protein
MVVGLGVGLSPVVPCVGTKGVVDLVGADTVGTVTNGNHSNVSIMRSLFCYKSNSLPSPFEMHWTFSGQSQRVSASFQYNPGEHLLFFRTPSTHLAKEVQSPGNG